MRCCVLAGGGLPSPAACKIKKETRCECSLALLGSCSARPAVLAGSRSLGYAWSVCPGLVMVWCLACVLGCALGFSWPFFAVAPGAFARACLRARPVTLRFRVRLCGPFGCPCAGPFGLYGLFVRTLPLPRFCAGLLRSCYLALFGSGALS